MGLCASSSAPPAVSAAVDSSDVRLDETPAPRKSPAAQSPELKRVSSERIVRARIDEAKKNKRDMVVFDGNGGPGVDIDLSSLPETYVLVSRSLLKTLLAPVRP